MKGRRFLWTFAVVLSMGLSFGAGAWFARHYRIVPVEQSTALSAVEAPALDLDASAPRDASSKGLWGRLTGSTPSAPPTEAPKPLLAFHFQPGENLRYRLDSRMTGKGFEALGPGDIRMGASGLLTMATDRVDPSGAADLTIGFERMSVSGDFMGSDYRLEHGPGVTVVNLGGRTKIDTRDPARSSKGVPQLQFLEDPLHVSVGPHGEVLHVTGGGGWGEMFRALPLALPLEVPEGDLSAGKEWDSAFTFPLPGADTPIRAKAHNRLEGYQYVGDRYCAVIRQQFDSRQTDGKMFAPDSGFGKEMTFGLPLFELTGTNYIYFDVNRGQIVHSTSDLKLVMKIGTFVNDVASVFKDAAQDLSDVLNGQPKTHEHGDTSAKSDTLDFVIDIDSTLSLEDAALAPTAQTAPQFR